MKRKISNIVYLFLLPITVISCKKDFSLKPVSFDVANRIFRVDVSSTNNSPFSVIIKQENPDTTTSLPYDITQVQQNSGLDFSYGFTPAIGKLIDVKVESGITNANTFVFYVSYKGTFSKEISMKATSTGQYYGEIMYLVIN